MRCCHQAQFGEAAALAFKFRDVAVKVSLMMDIDFVQAVFKWQELDLIHLDRVLNTIGAIILSR